jgi:DnaJ-class molecular chaperone
MNFKEYLIFFAVLYLFYNRRRFVNAIRRGLGMEPQKRPTSTPTRSPLSSSELDRAYETLDLKPGATFAQVQSAYRELARIWHPDRFANDPKLSLRANAKLSEINQAYETLRRYLRG